MLANAVQSLIEYRTGEPHAQRVRPSEEHVLPLLVALGAQCEGDRPQWINGTTHSVLSMDS